MKCFLVYLLVVKDHNYAASCTYVPRKTLYCSAEEMLRSLSLAFRE